MDRSTLLRQAGLLLADPGTPALRRQLARRTCLLAAPLSVAVESCLEDNGGKLQRLDRFPMLREIYDRKPRKLLLKCSRKTLKSTLLSNIIALNLLRFLDYKMLYVAPQELSARYFSNNYLGRRLSSPAMRRLYTRMSRDDIFEKIVQDTGSSVIVRYCRDDASRIRGPAVDELVMDEVQDIASDTLPIIRETMALSSFKREMLAGTPLTTDNTIHELWQDSSQNVHMTRCGCGHWNSLTEGNNPMAMIREAGLSCSRCSRRLDTSAGEWVEFNPGHYDLVGYHLAQPLLPFFNQSDVEWREVYNKVHGLGGNRYSVAQVHNEVFGLAYDTGTKPVSLEQLQRLTTLGDMAGCYRRGSNYYTTITAGIDWGVNMQTSRTAVCIGGLREDGVYEVFLARIYDDPDYENHIREIARLVNDLEAFCACDAGPDPIRGRKLGDLTSWLRTQLVRYEDGQLIQRYVMPANSLGPAQNRWCLHRSDTLSFVLDLVRKEKILFPRWEDSGPALSDLLNVFIEVKDLAVRQHVVYRHPAKRPDDFLHALNFAVCQAHVRAGNPLLHSQSSTAGHEPDTMD